MPGLRSLLFLTAMIAAIGLTQSAAAASTFPTPNTPVAANDDTFTVNEDGTVTVTIATNDVDPDGPATVVEIDGQPIQLGGSVAVGNGTVTANADGTLTFTPSPNYNGPISFTYTISDTVATGPAGISYHLESTNSNGPLLFTIDLNTGMKSFVGPLPTGGTTAMAYDDTSGFLYFIGGNGDLFALDTSLPTSTTALIGNIESTTNGWTTPVPAAYSHQTGSFYNGSLYLVPTARPAATVTDDALFRVDFANPTTISDVSKVADMSADTVEWNNNDDMAIDPATGVIYGRSDLNDRANSLRSSYFYTYDINTGVWNMVISSTYPYDYVTPSNNPPSTGFRNASIGVEVGLDGGVYGTQGAGEVGELDPVTGGWTVNGLFVPDDADLGVGGDLAGIFRFLNPSTATVTGLVTPVDDPPTAADDTTNTSPDTPVTIDPLTGSDSDLDGTIDPTTVTLLPPSGATTNSDGSIAVPGEGTWSVDPLTGLVTFDPEPGFSGTAIISYTVADNDGLVSNPANISVTVPNPESAASAQSPTPSPSTKPSTTAPRTLALTGPTETDFLVTVGAGLIGFGLLIRRLRHQLLVGSKTR